MDFLGIGPFELLFVLLLAFLFFGPEKLPGIAAKAGKLYRDFTRAANNLNKTISEEISIEKELEENKASTKTIVKPEPSSQNKNPQTDSLVNSDKN